MGAIWWIIVPAYAALLWRKIETLPLTKRVSSTLRHHMGNAGAGVPGERRRSTRRAFQGENGQGEEGRGDSGAILLAGDQISFSTGEERPFVSVGQFLHAGQRLASSVATPMPGQVIRIERGAVTMRRTETILAYARSQFLWPKGNGSMEAPLSNYRIAN
jgi:hypothetical protein